MPPTGPLGATGALRDQAGSIRELASRWLDPLLADPAVHRGDVVCSPAGLWLTLATLACGADGDTADDLADLLGVAGPEAAPEVTAVARELAATDALAAATSAWTRVPVHDSYRAALPDLHIAPLTGQAAVDAWVAQATGGLVTGLPAAVTPDIRLLLVNALALTARWDRPFTPTYTRPTPFTPATGAPGTAMMMATDVPPEDAWTTGGRDGAVTVVELPCAAGPDGAPGARVRFALGPARATAAPVMSAAWAPRHAGTPVTAAKVALHVPRFRLRTALDTTAHLAALGAGAALRPDADFTALSPEPLAVGGVVQETYVAVDEAGVRAASVTAAITVAAHIVGERLDVVLDRPFAFAVMDASGSVPLFSGWIASVPQDPSAAAGQ